MRLLYDTDLHQPGCVLLAAAYGADTAASNAFPAESWLVFPTDNLKVYEVTEEQLAMIVAKTEEMHR